MTNLAKQRILKLVLSGILDGGHEWDPIVVEGGKSCTTFVVGQSYVPVGSQFAPTYENTLGNSSFHIKSMSNDHIWVMCAAFKNIVAIYHLNLKLVRHERMREIGFNNTITSLQISTNGNNLLVGMQDSVVISHLWDTNSPLGIRLAIAVTTDNICSPYSVLLQKDLVDIEPNFTYLRNSSFDPMLIVEICLNEVLVVFESEYFGHDCLIYVLFSRFSGMKWAGNFVWNKDRY